MANPFHRLDRFLQQQFPQAYYSLVQKPRFFFRFGKERKHSRGMSLSHSKHQSILFFTTQKCASRYVGSLIGQLARSEGMPNIDYDAYVTMSNVPDEYRPFSKNGSLEIAFQSNGHFYGPLGTYRNIPKMKDYSIFLQLRDPRDVLTSLYFSTAFSHALINQKMVDRRKAAKKMTVDEFVLANANLYENIYAQYCQQLLNEPKLIFLKYELMVAEFENWLDQLIDHFAFTNAQDTRQRIIDQSNFDVAAENIYSQRRQVTPGDFRRKLKTSTIKNINVQFAAILKRLNY